MEPRLIVGLLDMTRVVVETVVLVVLVCVGAEAVVVVVVGVPEEAEADTAGIDSASSTESSITIAAVTRVLLFNCAFTSRFQGMMS